MPDRKAAPITGARPLSIIVIACCATLLFCAWALAGENEPGPDPAPASGAIRSAAVVPVGALAESRSTPSLQANVPTASPTSSSTSPDNGTGLLTGDYFLQAVMSLSWKDDQGSILCNGTYEERVIPPSAPTEDDGTITVRIQERWDNCPVRPRDVGAQVRVDRRTGQWLAGGEEVTRRWGWAPAMPERKPHSAYFEIVPLQPIPVFNVHSAGQQTASDAAYDQNGLWVWALRREDVAAGTGPAATVWEGWMVTSTSRLVQATAGLAPSPVHDAWWKHRAWLGPYSPKPDEFVAFQAFIGGQMMWRSGNRLITVLRSLDFAYRSFADTWTEETPLCPGADRLDPPVIRGFGNAWCMNEGQFPRSIGIPKEIEWGRDTAVLLCTGGQVIRNRDIGDIALLPDGTWSLYP